MKTTILLGKKINLVDYKLISILGIILFASSILFGILFRRPMSLFFLVVVIFACVEPVRALFRPYPEPTARRQFATLLIIMAIVAVLGAISVDKVIAAYHLLRGECPVWLEFSGRCRLR